MEKKLALKKCISLIVCLTLIATSLFVFSSNKIYALKDTVKVVDAGKGFALKSNGELYCWGENEHGQVGNGTTNTQLTPCLVMTDVKETDSFDSESPGTRGYGRYALKNNGELYFWGINNYGQVGNGTNKRQLTPYRVLSDVKKVETDGDTVFAVKTNGDLYSWGRNQDGQIGCGSTQDQSTPYKVLNGVDKVILSEVVDKYYSGITVSAITEEKKLYRWGNNYSGAIGSEECAEKDNQITPLLIDIPNVETVGFDDSWYYFLTNVFYIKTIEGDLYTWGSNQFGTVGNGDLNIEIVYSPYKVKSSIKKVVFKDAVYALDSNNDLYTWGFNQHGEVGNGTRDDEPLPTKIMSNVKDIGENYAITNDDKLYKWGDYLNTVPTLFFGNIRECAGEYVITKDGNLFDYKNNITLISDVKKYYSNTSGDQVAITDSGELYCWGKNKYGLTGNGSNKETLEPYKVLDNINDVKLEESNIFAITDSGELYCWGYNLDGRLGTGDTNNYNTPFCVNLLRSDNDEESSGSNITTTESKSNVEQPTNSVNNNTKKSNVVTVKPTRIKKVIVKKKGLKIIWKKVKGIDGYQIQYSKNKKFEKSKKITINKTNKKFIIIKGIKKNKTYYIRIRTYKKVNKKIYKSTWFTLSVKK